jgi:hypothetical protein
VRKTVSLVLTIVFLLGLCVNLSSCNRKYDEVAVKEEAARLIAASVDLNEIYWGRGIGYVQDASGSNGAYYEANFFDLIKYGIRTVDDLKAKTALVFSEAYCESIFATAFSSVVDAEELQIYARYYQKYEDENNTVPVAIMVYSLAKVLLTDQIEYHYDTIEVVGSKKKTVYVTIEISVTREDKTQTKVLKIGLLEEKNGWRLDTPTYSSYNEKEYDYNNLQNDK